MSEEPDSFQKSPFLYRICTLGIGVGLVIIYFQLETAGLFSPHRGFILDTTSAVLLTIGILLTILSFMSGRWLEYGRFCIVDPALCAEFQGDTSSPLRILIVIIIGFNIIALLIAFLSFPLIFRNHDTFTPYLLIIGWGIANAGLWFIYRTLKAKNHNESVSGRMRSDTLYTILTLLGCLFVLGINWYYESLPYPSDLLITSFVIFLTLFIFYLLFTIREERKTGKWEPVPFVLKVYFHTLWTRYGGLITIAVLLNTGVLFVFALISARVIPLELGLFYWILLGGILWCVNTMIVLMAVFLDPDPSNQEA